MIQTDSQRSWWIAAGALLVVVGLVVVALVRDPVALDPSTPEGTVQTYLQAVSDQDYETAISMIEPGSYQGCDVTDLAYVSPQEPFTATLGKTTVTSDTAFVSVTIVQGVGPGPFDPGRSGYPENFTLRRSEGTWLIVGEVWPYFGWRCPSQ
jgi:hypothetical protein